MLFFIRHVEGGALNSIAGGLQQLCYYRWTATWVDGLKEAAVFEVVLDDDVRDGVEDEDDVVGVGGAGEMRVNFFLIFPLVQVLKLQLDVSGAIFVILGP